MPFDTRSLRLTFGGQFFGTESWSCGLRISGKPLGDMGALDIPPTPVPSMGELHDFAAGQIEDVASKVRTWWSAMTAWTNPAAALSWVKLNPVTEAGLQDPELGTLISTFTPILGGSVREQFPQVALAVSLLTRLSRGRAHSGRMYLPIGGALIPDSTGHLDAGQALSFANMTATFINALDDWEGIDPLWLPKVVIMSSLGTGTRRMVTGVRVGRTIDTQRRRRSALAELYQRSPTVVG